MMLRALVSFAFITYAVPAVAVDRAELQSIQETPRHFVCRLDQTFRGNVHTPGSGFAVSVGIIEQSKRAGRPVPTIDLQITPENKGGTGSASGSFLPGRTLPKPITLELQHVFIVVSYDGRQTVQFVARGARVAVPLTIVQTFERQWWLSISSGEYPTTRTHDYLCEDVPPEKN
ncbi:hypothetical protein N8E89_22370 (plasmid) [Phyllobacterium sp. A18/5-2]|uniref:hypothetical protein n=1 Tax=Phyllobacterium sp. A18/5-2 TaxID=2978392 RepID=UPI0021C68D92|nr:hypothetical protein [Phyllobacterium sp. A18/5-2]UXN66000.1 hypothetical protein N8E89_22370 [Phyllobacterium sp. A18/5-2]